MQLEHQFKTKSHNLIDLFTVSSLSQFMKKLETQSQIDVLRYEPSKYLGDGFEFFVEIFLKLHSVDNRIGLYNYSPVQNNDNGVDGTALNIKGNKSVVQIKYRSNTKYLLTSTEDKLSNLFSDGMLTHGVVANPSEYRHFIFTTGAGLNFYTEQEMFKNSVKCFGYPEISPLVNNNVPFWQSCQQIIKSL